MIRKTLTTPVVFLFCIYADTALKSREMDHQLAAAAAVSVGSMFVGNVAIATAENYNFGDALKNGTLYTGFECLFASTGGLYYALRNWQPTIVS